MRVFRKPVCALTIAAYFFSFSSGKADLFQPVLPIISGEVIAVRDRTTIVFMPEGNNPSEELEFVLNDAPFEGRLLKYLLRNRVVICSVDSEDDPTEASECYVEFLGLPSGRQVRFFVSLNEMSRRIECENETSPVIAELSVCN